MAKDPFVRQASDSFKFDVTPIENLFLIEYMPSAPAEYVKVYLYALFQSRNPAVAEGSLDAFAVALGLDTETVIHAMRYWQRLGLVAPVDGDASRFEVKNVRSAMLNPDNSIKTRALYRYAEFNARLDTVTKGRQFTETEYSALYEFMDSFGFTEDAVLAVAEHVMNQGGTKKGFVTRMATQIHALRAKGCVDANAVRAQLEQFELVNSPCREVISRLGLLRLPTMDEHTMYKKWTQDWGFTAEGILAACSELTKIREPNFNYLDKVLETYRSQNATTAEAIAEIQTSDDAKKAAVRPYAKALGAKAQREFYEYIQRWNGAGLSPEATLFLCKNAAARGYHSFEAADEYIRHFTGIGITTMEGLNAHMELDDDAARMLLAAGLRRQPTREDHRLLKRYRDVLPFEVILEAASASRDADKPLAYLNALLMRLKAEGVTTLAGARKVFSTQSVPKKDKSSVHLQESAPDFQSDVNKNIIEL